MDALPQELLEEIVWRTSPVHACGNLSLLSRNFCSAAKSDRVWEKFLPIDIISRRAVQYAPWNKIDLDTLHAFPTKKDLYLFLSENPLSIDNGDMYFWLDKLSGNKCFHLSPRARKLSAGDADWRALFTNYLKESRFSESIVLCQVENLQIEGKISLSLLSPNIAYTAYLLFDRLFSSNHSYEYFGEDEPALETCVVIDGYGESRKNIGYIRLMMNHIHHPDMNLLSGPQFPVWRKDGCYEVKLGDYLNSEGGDNSELLMSMSEVKSGTKRGGISLLGIEIRPKSSNKL